MHSKPRKSAKKYVRCRLIGKASMMVTNWKKLKVSQHGVNNLCTPSDDAFTVVSTARAFMAIITTEVTTATDKAMRSIKLGGNPTT